MKKSISLWQLAGFVFTGIAGTLLHFLYEWTGENRIAALFSGVNESTWEHMKLLFFPLLIFAIIESRYIGKEYNNFWCVKLIGILLGLSVIPVLYYTYTGIFGKNADWFNITIFFIATAVSYIAERGLLKKEKNFCPFETLAKIILLLIAVLFFVFTFAPPQIPLFKDPITKLYGINA